MTIPTATIFPSASKADVRNRYQLGRELGKGGGGVVRVCGDLVTGEPVAACKSIPKCKLQRKEAREELQGEVTAMRKVGGHAHVVSLQGLYEDGEGVHLVMDLCSHGDLYEYLISRTVLPEPMAADVTRQILLALHHCHASGVIHRDIKPENILISFKDEAAGKLHLKLADFGLAVMLRAGQQAVGMYGSAVYMSPEVVCRRPYGPPVDLWGLGVILYTALSGYMPFWGSTDEQLFFRILRNQPDFSISPWPTVAPAAIDLVRWLLSSDPSHRPSAAAALQHPWIAQHCGRQTLPAHRPAPAPSVPPGAGGLPGESGAGGGREMENGGERVKGKEEGKGAEERAKGRVSWADGFGSGKVGAAGSAAASSAAASPAAAVAMDTGETGSGEQQRRAEGEAGAGEDEERQRQEQAHSAREGGREGGMDVDMQGEEGGRSASKNAAGGKQRQQNQNQNQNQQQQGSKQPSIQLPLFTSFTGPSSPIFSLPARTGSGSSSGVFLFTARPSSGSSSSSHRGSMGGMWDGSRSKHKEQHSHRHSHAGTQQAQQQQQAAAGGSKQETKAGSSSGTAAAPEPGEQKSRRSSHFRFFSPKRKARRSHVVVSAPPLPAPPPPPLSSPSSSRHSTLDPTVPHSTGSHSPVPMASITVPIGKRTGDTAATAAAAAADGGAAAAASGSAAASVVSVTIPVIPAQPPLDPTQELPSVPEIQARLSGPDGSIPVSSLFSSLLRPISPWKPSSSQSKPSSSSSPSQGVHRSESSPVLPSHAPSAPSAPSAFPSFLYSPRDPLKAAFKAPSSHKQVTASSSGGAGVGGSGGSFSGSLSASSTPRVVSAAEATFGRLTRPLQGMASLIRPSSPSTSASASASMFLASPCESPQHSMGAGEAGGRAGGEDDGSRRTGEQHGAGTSSGWATAGNTAGVPPEAAAASAGMPAVAHAPRKARGLSSILKAFASLSTAAAAAAVGPIGGRGSMQQEAGGSLNDTAVASDGAAIGMAVRHQGGSGREHGNTGSMESQGVGQARTMSEGTGRGTDGSTSSVWQRQGSWIFRR